MGIDMSKFERRLKKLESESAGEMSLSVRRWFGQQLTEQQHAIADQEQVDYIEPLPKEIAAWPRDAREWLGYDDQGKLIPGGRIDGAKQCTV